MQDITELTHSLNFAKTAVHKLADILIDIGYKVVLVYFIADLIWLFLVKTIQDYQDATLILIGTLLVLVYSLR